MRQLFIVLFLIASISIGCALDTRKRITPWTTDYTRGLLTNELASGVRAELDIQQLYLWYKGSQHIKGAPHSTIFIAYRTDGKDGIGTEEDPRDASTDVKWDRILSNAPNNTVVFVVPSLHYQTAGQPSGSRYAGLGRGSSLIGLGSYENTKLTLSTNARPHFDHLHKVDMFNIGYSSMYTTNSIVANIWFDGNQEYFTKTNPVKTAIHLVSNRGSENTIKSCKFTGFWGYLPLLSEGFPVCLDGTHDKGSPTGGHRIIDNRIEMNIDHPDYSYLTCVNIGVHGDSETLPGQVMNYVTGNYIENKINPLIGKTGQAVTAGDSTGIYYNTVIGFATAFYNDSWRCDYNDIAYNYVYDCNYAVIKNHYGVGGGGTNIHGTRIHDNNFETSGAEAGIGGNGVVNLGYAYGCEIYNNRFKGLSTNLQSTAIFVFGRELNIYNNYISNHANGIVVIQPSIAVSIEDNTFVGVLHPVIVYNNKTTGERSRHILVKGNKDYYTRGTSYLVNGDDSVVRENTSFLWGRRGSGHDSMFIIGGFAGQGTNIIIVNNIGIGDWSKTGNTTKNGLTIYDAKAVFAHNNIFTDVDNQITTGNVTNVQVYGYDLQSPAGSNNIPFMRNGIKGYLEWKQ